MLHHEGPANQLGRRSCEEVNHTIKQLGGFFFPCFQTLNCKNLAPGFPSHGVTLRNTCKKEPNQVEDPRVSSFKIYGGPSWEVYLDGNLIRNLGRLTVVYLDTAISQTFESFCI